MSQTIDLYLNRLTNSTLRGLGIERRQLRLSDDSILSVRTRDVMANRLGAEKWFEPAVRNLIATTLGPGKTFVDVGANIGYYSILGGRLVGESGRVLAIEPQQTVFSELVKNLNLNNLKNSTPLNIALSDQRATTNFYVPETGREALGSLRQNKRFDVSAVSSVEMFTLDEVLATHGIAHVDLLKIDVEGAELPVLKGAIQLLSSEKPPVIVFEANEINTEPFEYCVFDLLSYLSSLGFRLRQLDTEDWVASRGNEN